MATRITFAYEGKDYTLEYTRKAVEVMERAGLDVENIGSKPMTSIPLMFRSAFIANHPTVKRDTVDEIYSKMTNKSDLFGKLVEMYGETLSVLTDEPEEDEGNVQWGTTS